MTTLNKNFEIDKAEFSQWVPAKKNSQETSNSRSYLRLMLHSSDFTVFFFVFFSLKTNQKLAILVWIFTCVDFHGKIIKTKGCRNCEQYYLKS